VFCLRISHVWPVKDREKEREGENEGLRENCTL